VFSFVRGGNGKRERQAFLPWLWGAGRRGATWGLGSLWGPRRLALTDSFSNMLGLLSFRGVDGADGGAGDWFVDGFAPLPRFSIWLCSAVLNTTTPLSSGCQTLQTPRARACFRRVAGSDAFSVRGGEARRQGAVGVRHQYVPWSRAGSYGGRRGGL
jgi:hypothetical protein